MLENAERLVAKPEVAADSEIPAASSLAADAVATAESVARLGQAVHGFAIWELRLPDIAALADRLGAILGPLFVARDCFALKCVVFAGSRELASAASEYLEQNDLTFVEVLFQPPAFGNDLIVSCWRIAGPDVAAVREPNTISISQPEVEWHSLTVANNHRPGVMDAHAVDEHPIAREFTQKFAAVRRLLGDLGSNGLDLVRTWLCIQDINGCIAGRSNYQELNRARAEQFETLYPRRDHAVRAINYPASTGIGTYDASMHVSALACRRMADVSIKSVENPRQLSAFVYTSEVSEVTPLFARAVMVATTAEAMLIVSGTASITGERSVYLESAAQQTRATLENIGRLVSSAVSGESRYAHVKQPLDCLTHCVVYIKYRDHAEEIRAVCQDLIGNDIPVVYVLADICRQELLVEVEAIAMIGGRAG
jgi:enamine deaminase RidA (YjgF/YER057c/UK114 family)